MVPRKIKSIKDRGRRRSKCMSDVQSGKEDGQLSSLSETTKTDDFVEM